MCLSVGPCELPYELDRLSKGTTSADSVPDTRSHDRNRGDHIIAWLFLLDFFPAELNINGDIGVDLRFISRAFRSLTQYLTLASEVGLMRLAVGRKLPSWVPESFWLAGAIPKMAV